MFIIILLKLIHIRHKLEFQLDNRSLEILYMYLSFIRPFIEYADVVYTNCTHYEKNELDKILYEASRIVSGASKLVSLHELLREVPWETLEIVLLPTHKLIFLYQMKNGFSPDNLSSLVPSSVGEASRYICIIFATQLTSGINVQGHHFIITLFFLRLFEIRMTFQQIYKMLQPCFHLSIF